MSDQFWKKLSTLSGLLVLGALSGVIAYVANLEIKDLDLWLHLAVGKFITLNHFVPSVDILSCSIAGKPWVNHEWLFQVIVYNIFERWGADGLIQMQVWIVMVTMLLLLFLGYNKNRQLGIAFLLFLVYMVYHQRFTIRPDIYSLLFFAIYIYVLALHIDKRFSLLVLFITQVLWTNIHGFFFFGPVLVGIGVISEWLKRSFRLPYEWNKVGRLTTLEYDRLKKMFGLVLLACLCNPLFLEGALYPVKVLFSLSGESKIFFEHIQELQKPVTWDTIFDTNRFIYFKLLILISFVSFVFNRRNIDVSALILWALFLIFGLQAARNATYFAFAAYLVVITNILNISPSDIVPIRFTAKKFQYITSTIAKLLFLLWILQYSEGIAFRGYYDFDKYERKSEFGGISQRSFPNKAADFLAENKIKGNFFNDFNSGAYLLGRTYPDIKVFIDGRTEVYGAEFFKEYQKVWVEGDGEVFESLVAKHNLTGAFLNSTRQHIPAKLFKYLYEHKDWVLVYFDYDAAIFLRNVVENKEWIRAHKINLKDGKVEKADLLKLGATRVSPYRYYYRAYSLETLDLDDAALAEAREAIAITPNYSQAYEIIGKVYAKRKEYRKAFEQFRIAATLTPHNKQVRYNLALSYLDMKEYKGAIRQYQYITDIWPDDPKGYFFLSKALAHDGQYEPSLSMLRRAHKMDPKALKDILKIAEVVFENKVYPIAKEMYALALTVDPSSKEAQTGLEQIKEVENPPN